MKRIVCLVVLLSLGTAHAFDVVLGKGAPEKKELPAFIINGEVYYYKRGCLGVREDSSVLNYVYLGKFTYICYAEAFSKTSKRKFQGW